MAQRGKRAEIDRDSGEVRGSGSGAGAAGHPGEDHDKDPQAGAGRAPMGAPSPVGDAQHGPRDRQEGGLR